MQKNNDKNSRKKFADRLKAIRESVNLSQEQIHYATGIIQTHISKIESGKISIGIDTVSTLSDFFGVEDFQLFQYDEPIPDPDLLRKNVHKYLLLHDINPHVFLKKSLMYAIREKILNSKFMDTPRLTKEIAGHLHDKYDVKFTTTRISDALEELRRKGLVEKLTTDKKSKFQYRKV
ncbi:helix-turn-helix domain-containing protein [Ohtaekwangia koreensis]|uniref:Helix-turn-helix domain-containing protein n=1 Tax=Ohtaekwangia koreensis TaxID=688867 RepID=A0A1T5MA75_9BACT|nr:helix-turn-helix transcriptional regulator [Ohtaekwangia koreensis]SKC85045.1 Helix-turn-helix domain-containing protein [Ohtaekwangia koreensis]